jgi:hypothetical protein
MTNDNYATDSRIMDLFRDWFDPCPLNPDPQADGLSIDWEDRTYVNPPYSKPLPWVRKALEENKKGKLIVMLLRMDTSTEWFKLLQEGGAVFLWINGRLRFNDCGKPANFPSMLVILNKGVGFVPTEKRNKWRMRLK